MGLTDDLKAYWKLDESTGSRQDSTANNHDLTDNNTVLSESGKISRAALFDADNSESLSMSDHADVSLNNTSFTISFWFRPQDEGVDYPIVCKRSDNDLTASSGNEYTVWMYQSGPARYFRLDVGSTLSIVSGPLNLIGSTVYGFGAVVYDKPEGKYHFYYYPGFGLLSAALGVQTYSSAVEPSDGSNALRIGSNNGTQLFADGAADEVGIWKRALSADEVGQLWSDGNGQSYPFEGSLGSAMDWLSSSEIPVLPRVPHEMYEGTTWDQCETPTVVVPDVSDWWLQASEPVRTIAPREQGASRANYFPNLYVVPPVSSWWSQTQEPVQDRRRTKAHHFVAVESPWITPPPTTFPAIPDEVSAPEGYQPRSDPEEDPERYSRVDKED